MIGDINHICRALRFIGIRYINDNNNIKNNDHIDIRKLSNDFGVPDDKKNIKDKNINIHSKINNDIINTHDIDGGIVIYGIDDNKNINDIEHIDVCKISNNIYVSDDRMNIKDKHINDDRKISNDMFDANSIDDYIMIYDGNDNDDINNNDHIDICKIPNDIDASDNKMNMKDKHIDADRKISNDANYIDEVDAIKDRMTVGMINNIVEVKSTDIIIIKRNVDNIIIISITAMIDIICATKHIKWNL
ncbi:hypothetical protein CHCC16874_1703 [Bacillus licheniformis]|nr:hypothetical protein CHCC16874_1703 [Bacillus licheniformis]